MTGFDLLRSAYRNTIGKVAPLDRHMKDLVRTAVLPPLEWARRFHTLPSDPVSFRLSMLFGQHERSTRVWVKRLVTEGAVVCDVGAHVGYHTVTMARRAGPSGRVFAFERNPATARLLLRNTRRFSNVEVVNAAVADFEGTALLTAGGGDSSTFHVVAAAGGSRSSRGSGEPK